MANAILKIKSLNKYFSLKKGLFGKAVHLNAVDNVSLEINEGETIGLVGESGCGKTTLGRLILRLIDSNSGSVIYNEHDLTKLSGYELKRIRKDVQIIFQDPFSSLNPRMTVGNIIGRNLKVHKICKGKDIKKRIAGLLENVGISSHFSDRYPHEFSGGQRQRIAVARALATEPKLIIADEPTSALDVSVQAQILNLLSDLKKQYELTMIFISHDISVVKHISDRVAVMYLGKIVEVGEKDDFFKMPLHPYAKALLSAVPQPNPKIKLENVSLAGEIPSPINPPSGCRFHPRCSSKMEQCSLVEPEEKNIDGRYISCFLY